MSQVKEINKHLIELTGFNDILIFVNDLKFNELKEELNLLNVKSGNDFTYLNSKTKKFAVSDNGTIVHYSSTDILGEMSRFNILKDAVEKWGEEKGILEKGTPLAQSDKTLEEAQEIKDAILEENKEKIIDGIGDTLVTLILQAKMQNVNILDCLSLAYDIISKRTGEMINGKFVKDE